MAGRWGAGGHHRGRPQRANPPVGRRVGMAAGPGRRGRRGRHRRERRAAGARAGHGDRDRGAPALRVGARPLVADVNAIAPSTMRRVADRAGPGAVRGRRRGDQRWAARPQIDRTAPRCTCPVRRGTDRRAGRARGAQRGRRARAGHGVGGQDVHGLGLQGFLRSADAGVADRPGQRGARSSWSPISLRTSPKWPTPGRSIASSASKSDRFPAEMREIARTQADAGAVSRAVRGVRAGIRVDPDDRTGGAGRPRRRANGPS